MNRIAVASAVTVLTGVALAVLPAGSRWTGVAVGVAGCLAVAVALVTPRWPGGRPAGGAPRRAHPHADREVLVAACIYVRDRTTSGVLADRLGAALHAAGVRTVAPSGVRFDPVRHAAGGSAPCSDPGRVGTVAAVELAGYADRDGRLLRVPVVTVYRAAGYRAAGGAGR